MLILRADKERAESALAHRPALTAGRLRRPLAGEPLPHIIRTFKFRLLPRKAKTRLAAAHEKIARSRRTFLHQASARLIRENDRIAIENLNVKGLARGMLALDVNDAGWFAFTTLLLEKAESAGRVIVKVDPRNTSQICSGCGVIVPKALSVRTHDCPHCGLVLDRDVNAARNVLRRAVLRPGALQCRESLA